MPRSNIKALQRTLGYQFQDISLLQRALTHRSFSSSNNERFEFLGDSLLNCIVARRLFDGFPESTEGELSRLRAYLVKGDMLAEVAREHQIGDFLNLGPGELKSGGFRRSSILADGLEAIIAAVFLDGGFEACSLVVGHLFNSRFEDKQLLDSTKDSKTLLQEILQGAKLDLPSYELLEVIGEHHDQEFCVSCRVDVYDKITIGKGGSRRKAEKLAANEMINWLKSNKLP